LLLVSSRRCHSFEECDLNRRMISSSGFPLFAKQMFDRLGTVGASALLAGLTCCLAPLPFVFYRIGGRVRERSKFGAGSKVNEQNTNDNKKA
jgi:hypothetical protein